MCTLTGKQILFKVVF